MIIKGREGNQNIKKWQTMDDGEGMENKEKEKKGKIKGK